MTSILKIFIFLLQNHVKYESDLNEINSDQWIVRGFIDYFKEK